MKTKNFPEKNCPEKDCRRESVEISGLRVMDDASDSQTQIQETGQQHGTARMVGHLSLDSLRPFEQEARAGSPTLNLQEEEV